MKVIFFGSSNYCIPVLEALRQNFELSVIITKFPPNPVYSFAKDNKIEHLTPLNTVELLSIKSKITSINPDISIVADYGFIIPEEIFTIPRLETLNIHFSALPNLRGASPVQYTILFGTENASVSVIKMAKTLDTGDILKIINYPEINVEKETTKSLYEKLFQKISLKLPQIINGYSQGLIKIKKQNDKNASYTRRIKRDDGFLPFGILKDLIKGKSINLNKEDFSEDSLFYEALSISDDPAKTCERALRAFSPWPGIWTLLPSASGQKMRLKILDIEISDKKVVPLLVQMEGKRPVSFKQFLEGYPEYTLEVN